MAGFKYVEYRWNEITGKVKRMTSDKQISITAAVHDRLGQLLFKGACEAADESVEVIGAPDWLFRKTGIHHITGNLFASMGVLVTRFDGNRFRQSRQYAPIARNKKRPTRSGLGKGERYNQGEGSHLQKYYDGTRIHYIIGDDCDFMKVYRGRTNAKRIRGSEERAKFLQGFTKGKNLSGSPFYQIVCFVAMPYARYVETIHKVSITQAMAYEVRQSLKGHIQI